MQIKNTALGFVILNKEKRKSVLEEIASQIKEYSADSEHYEMRECSITANRFPDDPTRIYVQEHFGRARVARKIDESYGGHDSCFFMSYSINADGLIGELEISRYRLGLQGGTIGGFATVEDEDQRNCDIMIQFINYAIYRENKNKPRKEEQLPLISSTK